MREIKAILDAGETCQTNGSDCVLATVVHVEGSSYRRAGARMLIDELGNMTGAISGGCLEGDALKKALLALHQNQNKLVTYDTSDENDAVIGAQLGCNGVIQVLFEPIDFQKETNPLTLLRKAFESTLSHVIGTFFHLDKSSDQPGTILLMNEELKIHSSIHNKDLIGQLKLDAQEVFRNRESIFREYRQGEKSHYVFLEAFTPPPHLVLVGAGNDAQLLAQMADILGWDVTVTDGRDTHANKERFSACSVLVSRPEQVLENLETNDQTAFVLMTHNYNYDLAVLKTLLEINDIPYIGILGPKKKFDRMLKELKDQGCPVSNENLERIYAPVGLDLGAETPSEIGLSILSEIQAVLTGTDADFLKNRNGPIHKTKNNHLKTVIIE